jgi:hypothetical protein
MLSLMFIALSMLGQTAVASTPDGQTPANEGVCDELMADGTTKGLYGLCVAFCEAQDFSDENLFISPEDLIALESSPPPGSRILANYNKRRADSDPEMPCIQVVEGPCPCFNAATVAAIDGYTDAGLPTTSACEPYQKEYPGGTFSRLFAVETTPTGAWATYAGWVEGPNPPFTSAPSWNGRATNGTPIVRTNISPDQLAACKELVLAAPACQM